MQESELNKQQAEAAEKILEWYNKEDDSLFVLSGYAGCGKSFLISYFVKNIIKLEPDEVAFCAPTGKAAVILMKKGQPASTLHRLIYDAVEVESETIIDGEIIKSKKTVFKLKKSLPPYKLIVLDEVSMVSDKMLEDLLTYGIKVLASGDPAQIPAVSGECTILEDPDFILTEIVRQEADNPIIKIATMARNGERIPFGNYGTVLVIPKENLDRNRRKLLFTKADQVLCALNRTRSIVNREIREYLGIDPNQPLPDDGEKSICISNNWGKIVGIYDNITINLVNGMTGYCKNAKSGPDGVGKVDFQADFMPDFEEYYFDEKLFDKGEFGFERTQEVFEMADGSYYLKRKLKRSDFTSKDEYKSAVKEYASNLKNAVSEEPICFFEPAHCITVFKAQGSEWDSVVILDESNKFPNPEKILYTAITRAKRKVVIIR